MNKDLLLVIGLVVGALLVVCGGMALLAGLAFWLVWNHIAAPVLSVEPIGYGWSVLVCWAVLFLAGSIRRICGGPYPKGSK